MEREAAERTIMVETVANGHHLNHVSATPQPFYADIAAHAARRQILLGCRSPWTYWLPRSRHCICRTSTLAPTVVHLGGYPSHLVERTD